MSRTLLHAHLPCADNKPYASDLRPLERNFAFLPHLAHVGSCGSFVRAVMYTCEWAHAHQLAYRDRHTAITCLSCVDVHTTLHNHIDAHLVHRRARGNVQHQQEAQARRRATRRWGRASTRCGRRCETCVPFVLFFAFCFLWLAVYVQSTSAFPETAQIRTSDLVVPA